MYTQGTGCLFTYDPSDGEVRRIHNRVFEVPNTYVRWEGRELFIIHFCFADERNDTYSDGRWSEFCDWFEEQLTGLKPIYQRAEWRTASLASQMSDEAVTTAYNKR